MRHNHDRVLLFQLKNQFFDLAGRDRVERRAGFVHEQNLGLDGERAGDAQPLLLAARKAGARFLVQRVFYLVPERGGLQRLMHDLVQLFAVPKAVQLEPGRHIVVDRHGRKRIRLLKHHAHAAAQLGGRGSVINAEVADEYFSFHPRLGNRLVHAIQTPNERGFPAARGTDERGRVVGLHGDVDVEQRLCLGVKRIQVLDCNSDAHD